MSLPKEVEDSLTSLVATAKEAINVRDERLANQAISLDKLYTALHHKQKSLDVAMMALRMIKGGTVDAKNFASAALEELAIREGRHV